MFHGLRSLLGGFSIAASLVVLAGCAPSIKVTALPGETPGITPSGGIMTSTITVESQYGFEGFVTLSASCCHDVIRDRPVVLGWVTGFGVGGVTSPGLNIPKGGSVSTNLNIWIPGTAGHPWGKHLVRVDAKSGTVSATTNVGVRLVPTPAFETPPPCWPMTSPAAVLKLASTWLPVQISAAEATPRKTTLVGAIYMPNQVTPDTWKLTITDHSGLPPVQALIELKNAVSWEKEVVQFDGCSPTAGPSWGFALRVKGGQTGQMGIVPINKTLVFRKPVCVGVFCLTTQWRDVAVFADEGFWAVVGGKKLTFEWVAD